MRLNAGDGIQCDKCHAAYTEKFTYYSFDAVEVEFTGKKPSLLSLDNVESFDICDHCWGELKQLVIANNKTLNINRCDITNEMLNGIIYYVAITKVVVVIQTKSCILDEKYLEISISAKYYKQLVDNKNISISKNIESVNNEWTTN